MTLRKLATYWQVLLKDYRDVFIETYNSAKNSPIKSITTLCIFSGCIACCKMNPDELMYREQVIRNNQKLMMIGQSIRNPTAENYLKTIETYYNRGLIKRISFGLFSFITIKHKNDKTALYRDSCTYIKPFWPIRQDNVLDIGFNGKWWNLEKIMVDYDVNPTEWA